MTQVEKPIMAKDMLRSFGRVRGRIISDKQKKIIEDNLPRLSIADDLSDLSRAFSCDIKQLALEIGSGSGEFIVHMAKNNPQIGFVACEPYLNGISNIVQLINKNNIENIRIFRGDARILLKSLIPDTLDYVYILFPDPWPKAKHHKKRLINDNLLEILSKAMKSNAKLLIATDHRDYESWILSFMLRCKEFKWIIKKIGDCLNPPKFWIETRYQQKANKAGRYSVFLEFIRK